MELIKELKDEHNLIIEILKKVKEFGISTKEGQEELLLAKKDFLEHLKKEDEKIYPFLKKEAETNKNIKNILDIFAKEMDNISKTVFDFFDKYSSGKYEDIEFARDFGTLHTLLKNRVRREETILYDEYEKLY